MAKRAAVKMKLFTLQHKNQQKVADEEKFKRLEKEAKAHKESQKAEQLKIQ